MYPELILLTNIICRHGSFSSLLHLKELLKLLVVKGCKHTERQRESFAIHSNIVTLPLTRGNGGVMSILKHRGGEGAANVFQ